MAEETWTRDEPASRGRGGRFAGVAVRAGALTRCAASADRGDPGDDGEREDDGGEQQVDDWQCHVGRGLGMGLLEQLAPTARVRVVRSADPGVGQRELQGKQHQRGDEADAGKDLFQRAGFFGFFGHWCGRNGGSGNTRADRRSGRLELHRGFGKLRGGTARRQCRFGCDAGHGCRRRRAGKADGWCRSSHRGSRRGTRKRRSRAQRCGRRGRRCTGHRRSHRRSHRHRGRRNGGGIRRTQRDAHGLLLERDARGLLRRRGSRRLRRGWRRRGRWSGIVAHAS